MLQLILGRAGSGKTRYIYQQIDRLCKGEKGRALLIVPEQYTLESERALLREFGSGIGLSVEVCSFTRLCYRVLEQTGGLARMRLKKGAAVLLMAQALADVSDSLEIYKKAALRPEFITKLLNLYDELTAYRVPIASLESALKALPQNRRAAIAECCAILEAYRIRLDEAGGLYDSLELACNALDENRLFEGYSLFIDGFKSFTPQELEVLKRVFGQADRVFAAFCCEEPFDRYAGRGLFSSPSKTAERLIDMAKRQGMKVAVPILLKESYRFDAPELAYLEKKLFDYTAPAFDGECGAIELVQADSRHDETERAAQRICALVREKGMRYRDIIVIARNIEDYKGLLRSVFKKYGIPLFMDRRDELASKPPVALMLSAISAVSDGFALESVIGCVKTGLMGVDPTEADYLENYALMWGIHGKAWQQEWTKNPDGYGAEITEEGKSLLKRVNRARTAVIEPLLELAKVDNTDAGCITKGLYRFLEGLNVKGRIEEQTAEFERQGDKRAADEGRRLWNVLCEVLEQMSLALEGKPCTMKRYGELLRLLVSQYDIGHIPVCIDQVLAGSANHIRAYEGKAVFLLGVNDGVFPATPSSDGLLTDGDRQALTDSGLTLAATSAQEAFGEMILFYSAVTSVRERVYISYVSGGEEGSPMRPSMVVGRIQKLFPSVKVERENGAMAKIQSLESAFELAALGDDTPEGAALADYFAKLPEMGERLSSIAKSLRAAKTERLYDTEALKMLYGINMHISPSAAEKFHECGFAYFCRYGLRLSERKKASFSAPETGTMVHAILERFVSRYALLAKNGQAPTPERAREMTEEIAQEYIKSLDDGETSKRLEHLWGRIASATDRVVQNLVKELSQSRFVPVDFELSFYKNDPEAARPMEIALDPQGSVTVTGVVDRVDLYKDGRNAYLRVVDYKTGSKRFSLADVCYGLDMQMLIYLFALCRYSQQRYGQKALPGGILYLPASSPVLSLPRNIPKENIERELEKKLRGNGLLLSDKAVLEAMESGLDGRFIPVTQKKNGELSGKDSLADLELFGFLEEYVKQRIKEMGESILSGYAEAKPLKGMGKDACRWCEMRQICRFEDGRSVGRRVRKLTREESIKLIRKGAGK